MRISRKNETVDAEAGIFAKALGHRLRIADQCSSSSSPHQADSGPKIRTDLQVLSFSVVQTRHSLLSGRIKASECFLSVRNRVVGHIANQFVGCCPGFVRRFAYDDVQADAEADRAPVEGSAFTNLCDFLSDFAWRFTPGQVNIDVLPSDF